MAALSFCLEITIDEACGAAVTYGHKNPNRTGSLCSQRKWPELDKIIFTNIVIFKNLNVKEKVNIDKQLKNNNKQTHFGLKSPLR